jgi:hypothetical protein
MRRCITKTTGMMMTHSRRMMMTQSRPAPLLLVVLLVGAPSHGAAQDARPRSAADPCFEIIRPQRDMRPANLLLFNRCTGATWVLVRSDTRSVYRWVAVQIEDPVLVDRKDQVPAPKVQATTRLPEDKCFNFGGRRFCE